MHRPEHAPVISDRPSVYLAPKGVERSPGFELNSCAGLEPVFLGSCTQRSLRRVGLRAHIHAAGHLRRAMAADVCRGGEPFAFGDVGEAAMPQVAKGQVAGAFLAHDGARSRSEGLEVVEAREDTTAGRSGRLERRACPRGEPERAAVAFLVDVG